MTKKQTTQDNIFYYQEISQDILNLSLRFSYEEVGFYLTFKAAYIFHKGKIPFDKINQFCRIFSNQDNFNNFIKNNFKIEDGFVVSESFNKEIDFISKKSQERKDAAKSRWKNTNVDAIAYTNANAIGDAKHQTINIKQETLNNKQKKDKNFIAPTLQEIEAYCKERKSVVSAKDFYDYYATGNWKDAKGNQVRNWKQKLITWENKKKQSINNSYAQQSTGSYLDFLTGGQNGK